MSKVKQTAYSPPELFFPERPNYRELPWLTLGATDSAHKVFFVSNGNGPLAVKAYVGEKARARATHEKNMLNLIREAGFLTLTPTGVQENRDGSAAFLLTQYVPDLSSMSSVVQNRSHDVAQQVRRTAATLGGYNGLGLSHGDAQIKNFVIDPRAKRHIMVIDPEKGGSQEFGHIKNDPFQHDLDSLVQSLAYKGYGGKNPNQAGDKIIEDVITPYVLGAEKVGTSGFDPHQIGETALITFLDKHSDVNYRNS
jgi:Ser/Thr protein kinase RdoA (MazF antagonist)